MILSIHHLQYLISNTSKINKLTQTTSVPAGFVSSASGEKLCLVGKLLNRYFNMVFKLEELVGKGVGQLPSLVRKNPVRSADTNPYTDLK